MGVDLNLKEGVTNLAATEISFLDQIMAIVPKNIVQAMVDGQMLLVIRFAPIGLFGVVSKMVGSHAGNTESLSTMFGSLGIYAAALYESVTAIFIAQVYGEILPAL